MIFRSPYDRDFEQEQEIEHEAYQRGANNILNKIRAEIEQIADQEQKHDKKWATGLRYAVKIIDKYKA